MKLHAILLPIALLALPAFAGDDAKNIFCNGTFALCVKAPCAPIVKRGHDGKYSIEEANCRCEVATGWSMGPDSCKDREPVTKGKRTFLISAYSNRDNETNRTLTCNSKDTVWAWCLGSACVVDEKDKSEALCTCFIKIGPGSTLGGECRQKSCEEVIWSAAPPKTAVLANDTFYKYLKEKGVTPPPNPPAKACPGE